MKTKSYPLISLISVLALVSLSCKMLANVGGSEPTGTPPPPLATLTPVETLSAGDEPTEIPTKAPEATVAAPNAEPGSKNLYRVEEGGFAFQEIPGWQITDEVGMIMMLAPDGDFDFGPAVIFSNEVLDEDMTLNEMFELYLDGVLGDGSISVAEPQTFTLDGLPGQRVIITGDEDGLSMTGEILMAMVTPRQAFTMIAMAPSERWDTDILPYWDNLIASLDLFEIELSDLPSGNLSLLGETQTSPDGYFTYASLPGYQIKTIPWGVSLTTSESDYDFGPEVILSEQETVEGVSPNDLISMYGGGNSSISDVRSIWVSGVEGVTADYETAGGDAIGRTVVVPLDATHHFMALAYAPADIWNDTLSGQFEALLATIQFSDSNSGVLIRQWAMAAEATSEYGSDNWSAQQAAGAPDTFTCGDHVTAWAAAGSDTIESITLYYYDPPVFPTEVNIIQTHNPSQVVMVELLDPYGEFETVVYEAQPEEMAQCPYRLSIPVEGIDYLVMGVRVTIDQSVLGLGWNEIDAVELVGYPEDGYSQSTPAPIGDNVWENIYTLPIFPSAENVNYENDLVLSYTVSDSDRQEVLEFILEDLDNLGWLLDVDVDGQCRNKDNCMSKLMNLDYDASDNLMWFFIHSDSPDALLSLTLMESSGIVVVAMTLQ